MTFDRIIDIALAGDTKHHQANTVQSAFGTNTRVLACEPLPLYQIPPNVHLPFELAYLASREIRWSPFDCVGPRVKLSPNRNRTILDMAANAQCSELFLWMFPKVMDPSIYKHTSTHSWTGSV